ncbi:hypothetical protein STEG23_021053 [Scotinomys teguina]
MPVPVSRTLVAAKAKHQSFNLEDGNASSLEEAKEDYARMYSEDNSILNGFPQNLSPSWFLTEDVGKDEKEGGDGEMREEEEKQEEEEGEEEKKVDLPQSSDTLLPDLLEFERYLNFYKQMMDLLTINSIISPQEETLPIVSAAISHLWQSLSEEKKACLLQVWEQQNNAFSDLTEACLELVSAEDSVKDSGVDSQGVSCSLESTPEEILFEDAFEVAGFLDKSEDQHMSNISPVFTNCNLESLEEKFQLYIQIIDFLKDLCCVNTPLNQEPDPEVDDEMMLLKCLETFDDDDL